MDALGTVVGILGRCKDACTHDTRWRAIWISALAAVTVPAGSVFATGMVVRAQAPASGARTQALANAADPSITVHLGGTRGPTGVVGAGPNGAGFTATATDNAAMTGTCTIDNSAGTCTIENLPPDHAWNVRETTTPMGWFDNPVLETGSGGAAAGLIPTPYVFTTATLAQDQSVDVPSSNPDARVCSPGGAAAPTTGRCPAPGGAQQQMFSGLLAKSLDNPPPVARCGQNIALMLDQSSSVTAPLQAQLTAAANDAITALTGTPSTLSIFTFGSNAATLIGATSTINADSALPLHQAIGTLPEAVGGGQFTNYDAAFNLVATVGAETHPFDTLIFVTDGAPTASSIRPGVSTVSSELTDTEQGIFSANRVKAQETRITGLGIGLGEGTGLDNLAAVTGPNQGDDFFPAGTAGFGDLLTSLVTGPCNHTLTINKVIEDTQGQTVNPAPADANDWEFNNAISGEGTSIEPTMVTTEEVNNDNGFTSATVGIPVGTTATISVTETLMQGFTFVGAVCRVAGEPVDTQVVGTTATFEAPANEPLGCTFTNRRVAPPPPPEVSLSVTKSSTPQNTYTAGQTLTYHMTVNNGGPDTATNATVNDALPEQLRNAGFTWTCEPAATPTGNMCPASGSGPLVNVPVTIVRDGSVTFTLTGTVPEGTTGDLVNTVTVTPPPEAVDDKCRQSLEAGTQPCVATVTNTMVTPSVPPTASPTVPPVVPPTAAPATPGLPITGIGHAVTGMVGSGLAALGGLVLVLLLFLGQWGWRRRRNQG